MPVSPSTSQAIQPSRRVHTLRWDGYTVVAHPDHVTLGEMGRLRRRAYAAAGKAEPMGPAMVDALDRADHVRHLVWRDADGRMVASVRLALPEGEGDVFDLDHAVRLHGVLPKRRQIGEASRLVADPSLRSKRAMAAMTTAVSYELFSRHRRWVLLCADTRLSRFYETISCRALGMPFKHAELAGCEHEVFLGSVRGAVEYRICCSFVVWAFVFAPATARLVADGLQPCQDPWARVHVRLANSLAVGLRWALDRKAAMSGAATGGRHG